MSHWTERSILRQVARAAAAYSGSPKAGHAERGAELRRWLTVLEAWDAEHEPERAPMPLLIEHRQGDRDG